MKRQESGGVPFFVLNWFGWLVVLSVRTTTSPILHSLRREFGLSRGQAGLLDTAFLLSYALMQFLAGFLSSKFNRGKLMMFSLCSSSVVNSLISLSADYTHVLALRVVSGALTGIYFVASTSLLADMYEPRRYRALLGLSFTGAHIGTIVTLLAGGLMVKALGWRFVPLISLAFTLISLPFFLTSMPRHDQVSGGFRLSILKLLLKNRMVSISIIARSINFVVYSVFLAFSHAYVMEEFGVSPVVASLVSIGLPLAMMMGGLLGGRLSSSVSLAKLIWVETAMLLSAPLIVALARNVHLVFIALFLFGFAFTASNLIFVSVITEFSQKEIRNVALGASNSLAFLFSSFGPALFGLLSDALGFTYSFVVLELMLTLLPGLVAALCRGLREAEEA